MAEGERAHAMVDLEKELSCSICTDLLYQPLTLLDCLHTFCGACLKEWFQFQASTATSLHPYTCPSCRASVRGTKPNATVTTLLDMFLQANPGRGKSEADKKSDREKYKPGDNVLPKLRRREEPGAEEDRRLMEEVQQMSLREVGINNSLEPPQERRRADRSRERSRESRRRDREGHRSTSRNQGEASASRRETVPSRTVEHQSSLRSLLSSSEIDSQEIEEEIMRQIMEEGLLDGIDLNNINVEQEDEISERIAQAYRRRQRERQRERQERRERLAREGRIDSTTSPPASNEIRSPPISDSEQPRRRPHGRSQSSALTPQPQSSSRPPVSRPGLIDAANQGGRNHQRSSSQSSSTSTTRANRPASLSVTSARQASRSTSELSERPGTSGSTNSGRRRLSENQQRSTLEERQQFRASINSRPSSNPNSPRRSAFNVNAEGPSGGTSTVAPTTSSAVPPPASRRTTDPTHTRQSRLSNTGIDSPTLGPSRAITDPAATEPTSRASSITNIPAPTLYPEPEISCNRCGKEHLEHDLHFNCSRCDDGNYNLCLRCYRSGRGCKHWYGFGWAAWPRYERQAPPGGYPPNHEHPHILIGRRYQRPTHLPVETPTSSPQRMVTEHDPATRLEAGVFCDICFSFANLCYWKCDVCNEGDWGFCNDCVNQGKHCTHPLLPVAHNPRSRNPRAGGNTESASPPSTPRQDGNSLSAPEHTSPPLTPRTASLIRGPGHITIANALFRPLTFTTICNICTYPIPPSHTRFHCPECNEGDYDICTSCYHKLVSSGRITTENGMNGWRRCLRNHRMVVVGFEDRSGGQRRIVTRDLVGGYALKEEFPPQNSNTSSPPTSNQSNPLSSPTLSPNWSWRDNDGSIQKQRSTLSTSPSNSPNLSMQRFPPDGGIGLRVQALWSYYPADGVKDELMFPKGAEIREAEDINGDWFWGCYAGGKGLFPGNYARLVR